MAGETLEKIRQVRLEKVKKLRDMGINPYPARTNRTNKNIEIVDNYDELEGKEVTIAGRLMSWREHGKLFFGHVLDGTAKVQLYIKVDEIEDTNVEEQTIGPDNFELLDVGDFVEAKGTVTKTKRGEISVLVKTLRILTKSLRPLPDKWQGIKDKEERFRRRYLDILMNPEVKGLFERKSKFWSVQREILKDKGFMEVETPVLEHVTGGADARPFVTHHNELDQDFYLRISTELFEKRLIGAGFEKIYTLGPNFRNEGISDEHLQEYYQLEWYWAYADYKDNMKLVKELYTKTVKEVYGKTKFSTRGHTFDLEDEWEEIDYAEVIKEKLGVDIFNDTEEKMLEVVKDQGIKLDGEINRNRLIDNLWKSIRKSVSGPAFLINVPKFMSPLAKSKVDNPELTERFQVVIAGSELGNGYSEINDPVDQLDRFMEQEKLREEGDDEAQMLDIDFVEMLEYGMPPVSGWGHSERLFWFLEDVSAREGTLFPQLRFEIDDTTKLIYGDAIRNSDVVEEKPLDPNQSIAQDYTIPEREETFALLEKYVEDSYQRLHSRMVEAGMRAYADKYGEDPELWGATGLLHDIDFDKWPDEHPNEQRIKELTENKYPEVVYEAIMGHATWLNIPRRTTMAKALLAIDELAGLFFAVAKARPTGFDMKIKSIKKKFKDKAFAAKIDREEIKTGVEELGIELDEHFEFLIPVFKEFQSEL